MGAVYVHADVGRAGLGNMLLPWARAEVASHRHGWPMLAPQWTQPKIGPLLRGERDKRYYTRMFHNAGYVRGLRRTWLMLRASRIAESQVADLQPPAQPHRHSAPTLVVFRGLTGWFEPLLDHRDLVRRRLYEILSPATRAALAPPPAQPTISVHVRRGDMTVLEYGQPYPTGPGNFTMPLRWYVEAIRSIRRAVGRDLPVRLFSDAHDHQITDLLDEPGVERVQPRSAIADILGLSHGSVLIATGRSSFSGWAGFLGGMPTVFYPGTRARLSASHPDFSIEADLAGGLRETDAQTIARTLTASPA